MKVIEKCIRCVISGGGPVALRPDLVEVCENLSNRGADGIILGCTEFSVIFAGMQDIRFIDPLTIITRRLLP